MASKIEVNLDTSKELYGMFKCKQNDDLLLIANIYENGASKDLTNCSIVVQAKKADNTYIIQNTDITKDKNKFIANLVRDFTRVPGQTLIEVVLVESSKQNTTFSFCLEVIGSVIKGAEESKDLITSLEVMQDAVVEMGKISEETKELIKNSGAASKEEMNKVNASLADIEKQVSNYLNCANFGVVSSTQEEPIDISSLLQKAIDFAVSNNIKNLQLPRGNYYVSKTIYIPQNIFLECNGSTIIPMGDISSYEDNYIFIVNKTEDTDLKTAYASLNNNIKNLRITNTFNIANIKGFYVCCCIEIYNLFTQGLYQVLEIKDRYIDQIRLKNIIISNYKGTGYAIQQIAGSHGGNLTTCRGDCWEIDSLHITDEDVDNSFNRQLINFTGTNSGVKITNVLNGTIRLENGDFQLNNIYIESGGLIINNAFVVCENSYFYKEGNYAPILLSSKSNSKPVILKNVKFGYRAHAERPLTKGRFYPCILMNSEYKGSITIENCSQGMPREVNSRFGIKIASYSTNYTDYANYIPFDLFNSNSSTLSRYCVLNGLEIMAHNDIISTLSTNTFISSSKTQLLVSVNRTPLTWQGETGNYNYRVSAILDEQRDIGYTQSYVLNHSMTNGEYNLVKLYINSDVINKYKNFTLFVERGLNNNFTECCYVPMTSNNSDLYDDGLTLSGLRWKTVKLKDVRTLKASTLVKKNLISNNVEIYGGNTTVTGTWNKFDRIIQVNPTQGKDKAWVYNGETWVSEGVY